MYGLSVLSAVIGDLYVYDNMRIEILDVTGNVQKAITEQVDEVDVQGLLPGAYFVITHTDTGVFLNKLIIQ